MAVIPVVEWLPDAADLGQNGSVQVLNTLPGTNSYKPFPQFTTLSSALGARPTGAIDVRDRSGNVYQFAGDVDTLYQADGTSWTDVSKVGGYSTGAGERWEMILWKNKILATNFSDNIQQLSLGGANFSDLTTAFRCRRLMVVRDYVVACSTFDGSDGDIPDRVRWSAFNDETDWTVSPVTGSSFVDLNQGPIQRAFGGEYGVILGLNKTWRMDFVGAPEFFRVTETLPDVGVLSPGAASRIGDVVYAWSNQGFLAITNATGFVPIGAGKVDRFAFNDLDDSYLDRISSVADPKSGRIFWAYPGAGSMAGRPNKIICYDKNFNRWSLIEQDVELLWSAGGIGFTLESLDAFVSSLDDLPVSLDSSQWKGDGGVLLAAFDSSFRHGFFDGSPMSATIDTRELEISKNSRTMLQSFRPLVDHGSVTCQVGSRNTQSDDVSFGSILMPTGTGRFTTRSNARYHRIRMFLSGEWEDVLGVQIEDARPVGGRG